MPLLVPNPLVYSLRVLVCAFLFAAAFTAAQVPGETPSAPEPQRPTASDEGGPTQALLPLQTAGLAEAAGDASAAGTDAADRQPETAPIVSMAPHSQSARYWVSGQANSIFQMHGHFHSPYEGPNSLIDDFETKASEVGTLYLGYQLWPNSRFNTDLIVDFENAGGRGISQALGLAGETNVDVVRNPSLEHRAVSRARRDSSDYRLDQRDDRPGPRAVSRWRESPARTVRHPHRQDESSPTPST